MIQGCRSDTRQKNLDPGIEFIAFPKAKTRPTQSARWSFLCNIPPAKVHRGSYICSLHFPPGSILSLDQNPALEPFAQSHEIPLASQSEIVETVQVDDQIDLERSKCLEDESSGHMESKPNRTEAQEMGKWGKSYARAPRQTAGKLSLFLPLPQGSDKSFELPSSPSTTADGTASKDSVSLSQLKAMKKEIDELERKVKELQMKKQVSGSELLAVLEQDEEQFYFYTGSSFTEFKILTDFLGPAMSDLTKWGSASARENNVQRRTFSPKQELTLCLIKLRHDFSYRDMSYR